RGGSERPEFRRDGERFGRGERRDDSFGRRDRGFDGGRPQRGLGSGEQRTENRRFEGRDGQRGGFEGRGTEGRSSEGRGFEGRSSEGRGFQGRPEGRDVRSGFDRNRGTGSFLQDGKPGQRDDRYGQQGDRRQFGGRPGQARDRAARRPSN